MSDSNEPPAPTDGWREVRLALVLYGGVSMAIYMYGVVYEVWRAVRASRALERGEEDPDNPWTDVLRGVEKRVTVDIVSGASAGGINGILLGRALASGGDLDVARDVWLEKADFSELLAKDEDEPRSLLRSGYFEDELEVALERMGTDPSRRLVDVLDVIVSTTHLSGDRRDFIDWLGHPLATKRHDVPVRLRYRNPGRFAAVLGVAGQDDPGESARNDFDNVPLLVQLARATSAFPVAFEPIDRSAGEHGNDEWPRGHYTDGGVTDNKPFEQALETIFGRAAARPVRRWLLSVDPDPKPPKPVPTYEPDFLDVVAAATFAIPRYESIQQDLDRLYDHGRRVWTFWEGALDGLEQAIAGGTAEGASDSQYAGLRRAALVSFLTEEYRRARRDSATLEGRSTWIDDQLGISALLPFSEAEWAPIDTAFELRRTYYLIKLLGREAENQLDAEELIAARREMWRRFEAARSATWQAVQGLLDPDEPSLDLGALGAGVEGSAEAPGALEGLGNLYETYSGYEQRDRALLAVDPFGFRMPRDEIAHAQIDPGAAHALDDVVPASKRLAGDTLGHFGGFLERRWRENDILWGRLDSADVLVQALGLDGHADRDGLTKVVHGEIVCKTLDLDAGSDWRAALRASNPAGEENVGDIPGRRLSLLAIGAGGVAQRMFGSLSTSGRSGAATLARKVLKPLGSWVVRALTPLLFLLALAVGKGKGPVRLLAGVALVPAVGVTLYAAVETMFESRLELAIFAGGWALSVLLGYLAKRQATKT